MREGTCRPWKFTIFSFTEHKQYILYWFLFISVVETVLKWYQLTQKPSWYLPNAFILFAWGSQIASPAPTNKAAFTPRESNLIKLRRFMTSCTITHIQVREIKPIESAWHPVYLYMEGTQFLSAFYPRMSAKVNDLVVSSNFLLISTHMWDISSEYANAYNYAGCLVSLITELMLSTRRHITAI